MTDEEPAILICLPTKGNAKATVPGAVKRLCCRCRAQVWIAPSGQRIQRERGMALLCIACFLKDAEVIGSEMMPITPAQKTEIVAYLRDQR